MHALAAIAPAPGERYVERMSPRAAEVLALARELPDDEREKLQDALDEDADAGLLAELDRRSAALDAGEMPTRPVSEWLAELRRPAATRT